MRFSTGQIKTKNNGKPTVPRRAPKEARRRVIIPISPFILPGFLDLGMNSCSCPFLRLRKIVDQVASGSGSQYSCETICAPTTTKAMSTGPTMNPMIPMNGTPAKIPIIMMIGWTATLFAIMNGR